MLCFYRSEIIVANNLQIMILMRKVFINHFINFLFCIHRFINFTIVKYLILIQTTFLRSILYTWVCVDVFIKVTFLRKSFQTNFQNMRLFTCVSGDSYSNCFFLKVVCYKIYKPDVFHELYASADGPLGCFTSKIQCF